MRKHVRLLAALGIMSALGGGMTLATVAPAPAYAADSEQRADNGSGVLTQTGYIGSYLTGSGSNKTYSEGDSTGAKKPYVGKCRENNSLLLYKNAALKTQEFQHGFGVEANSVIYFDVSAVQGKVFDVYYGVDAHYNQKYPNQSSDYANVKFYIEYSTSLSGSYSYLMGPTSQFEKTTPMGHATVTIPQNATHLRITVNNSNSHSWGDWANWCNPRIINDIDSATVTSQPSTIYVNSVDAEHPVTLPNSYFGLADGDKALVEDTDYTITYANNTSVGTAKAILTGMGDYAGTKEIDFTIATPGAYPLTDAADASRNVAHSEHKANTACCQEPNSTEHGDEGILDKAFDDNQDNRWHSAYAGTATGSHHPDGKHWVKMELKQATAVSAVRYLPRNGNGDILTAKVQSSDDGTNWTDVKTQAFTQDGTNTHGDKKSLAKTWRVINFDAPVTAKYFRIVGEDTFSAENNKTFMSASEIYLVKASDEYAGLHINSLGTSLRYTSVDDVANKGINGFRFGYTFNAPEGAEVNWDATGWDVGTDENLDKGFVKVANHRTDENVGEIANIVFTGMTTEHYKSEIYARPTFTYAKDGVTYVEQGPTRHDNATGWANRVPADAPDVDKNLAEAIKGTTA